MVRQVRQVVGQTPGYRPILPGQLGEPPIPNHFIQQRFSALCFLDKDSGETIWRKDIPCPNPESLHK